LGRDAKQLTTTTANDYVADGIAELEEFLSGSFEGALV
jgi:hypothetical protein